MLVRNVKLYNVLKRQNFKGVIFWKQKQYLNKTTPSLNKKLN